MQRIVRTTALVLGLSCLAPAAQAQDSASAFERLSSVVTQGDAVIVTDADGREQRGRLTALSSSSLAIDIDGQRREWRRGDVWLVRHLKRDSLINGGLIGLVVGAGVGFGLAAGVATAELYGGDTSEESGGTMVFILGAALGTVTGLGIDAARRDEVVVYRAAGAPASGASVRLSPLVTRQAQGLRVAVVF